MTTTATETFALPSTYTWGYVRAQVIYAIADTAEDVDDKPQARAAAGKIVFTPRISGTKVTAATYPAIVLNGKVTATLSASGKILDAEGRQGIWLITGTYTVSFELTPTSDGYIGYIEPFEITVGAEHTQSAPLDLASWVPSAPPEGSTIVVMTVPTGGAPGQVLTKAPDGTLIWSTPVTGGSGSTTGDTREEILLVGNLTYIPPSTWDKTTGHLVVFSQDAAGGRVVDWTSAVRAADGDSLPVVSPTASSETWIAFYWSVGADAWIPTVLNSVTPPDEVYPTAGTMSATNITSSGFTVTVAGAYDARGLAVQPYSFSRDNGLTWTPYQASASYVFTGLAASTAYQVRHKVRDAAGLETVVSASTVTTASATVAGGLTSSSVDPADATTYTYLGRSIGATATTRTIVVGFAWRAASAVTVSSVTIGGVTATQDVATNQSNSGVWVGRAVVPAGTTADVVVTLSGPAIRSGLALWRIPSAVTVAGTNAGTNTATVTVPSGGYGVAVGILQTTDGSTPAVAGFTQDFSNQIELAGGLPFFMLGGNRNTAGAATATMGVAGTNATPATVAVAYGVA